MERWFFIDIRTDCFGLGSKDGLVTWVPERVKWMDGMKLDDIKPFLLRNKARVIELQKTNTA